MIRRQTLQPLLQRLNANAAPRCLHAPRLAGPSMTRSRSARRSFASSAGARSVYDDFRNILADSERPPIMVESITETSFKLTDGIIIPANCVFLNGVAFLWDVPPPSFAWTGWNREMFTIFEAITPKPDILLLGTGRSALPPPAFLRPYLNSLGIQLDTMDSRNVCSTFNLLAEEGRRVAAAVLTLAPLDSRSGMPLEMPESV